MDNRIETESLADWIGGRSNRPRWSEPEGMTAWELLKWYRQCSQRQRIRHATRIRELSEQVIREYHEVGYEKGRMDPLSLILGPMREAK